MHTNETSQSVKQSSVKSNLSEMQSRMSQMKALTSSSQQTSTSSSTSSSSTTSSSQQQQQQQSSLGKTTGLSLLIDQNKHLVDAGGSDSPLDTGTVLVQEVPFPSPTEMQLAPMPNPPLESPNLVMNNHPSSVSVDGAKEGTQSFRFEQKKVASSSSTKIRSGNFSAEQSSANAAQMKRVQTGDVKYEEKQSAQAIRHKVEMDGITAEKSAALKQEQRQEH
jgi:hypothetical protein